MLLASKFVQKDPLLSLERIQPTLHSAHSFGPVVKIIEDEFGDDARLLIGDHLDTLSLLSSAVLNTPKGEPGLRRFLRHLRSLLGSKPSPYMHTLIERAQQADKQAEMSDMDRADAERRSQAAFASLERELADVLRRLAEERDAWGAKFALMQHDFDAERTGWAFEYQRLDRGSDHRLAEHAQAANDALAAQRESRCRSEQWAQSELEGMRRQMDYAFCERDQLAAEVQEGRRLLAERDRQLGELRMSQNIGAAYLGGSEWARWMSVPGKT